MSNRFVNIIDYSLLPMSILILGKTLGLYFVVTFMGIEWGVGEYPNNLVSVTPIVYGKDLLTVSTYSNLILFVLFFLAFSMLIITSRLRHTSARDINILRSMLKVSYANFFQKGAVLYARVYVWLIYMWLLLLYIGLDVILGRTEAWVALFSYTLGILVTTLIITDTQKEFTQLTTLHAR